MQRRQFVAQAAALAAAGPLAAAGKRRVALRPWWTPDQFDGVAGAEQRLLELTNAARREHDLPAVTAHPSLQVAARQHSREMVQESYFAHEAPHAEWREPSQRAYRAGYWEAFVAENIIYLETGRGRMADGPLADLFMNGEHGWMNSAGHRANILNRDYTHLGIGVFVEGSKHYATQLFGQHTYEFSDVGLEVTRGRYEVSGRARLTGADRKVYIALDQRVLQTVEARRGEWFGFRVAMPEASGRHRIGLHPSKDARSYWLKFVFFVDTGQPAARAFTAPFDP